MTLCALQDVKTYLGITDTNTDTVLTNLVTNVSAAIETYCNRTFEENAYTETYNGGTGQKLFLKNAPIVSVASLTVNGQSVPPAPDTVSYGYVNDDVVLYIRRGPGGTGGPQEFYKGIQNIQVTYTAGFASIPNEVNQAAVMWVAWLFNKRLRLDKRNETLGQQQTIGYDMSDMPSSVKTLLSSYIRWNPL